MKHGIYTFQVTSWVIGHAAENHDTLIWINLSNSQGWKYTYWPSDMYPQSLWRQPCTFPPQLAKKTCGKRACTQLLNWGWRIPRLPCWRQPRRLWQAAWREASQPPGSKVLVPSRTLFPQHSLLIFCNVPVRAWSHSVVHLSWCQLLCDYSAVPCHGASMGQGSHLTPSYWK